MTGYSDIAFNETFDTVYNDMLNKKNNDSSFVKRELKELLGTLYINEENNRVGQSEIVVIKLCSYSSMRSNIGRMGIIQV